jgi:hypothetical protein
VKVTCFTPVLFQRARSKHALREQFPNAVIFRKVTAPAAANLRTFVDRNDPKKMVRFDLGTEDGRRQANALGTDYVMIDTPSLSDIRDDPEDRSANITLFVNRNDPKRHSSDRHRH